MVLEQSRAIGELTIALREGLAVKEKYNKDKPGKPRQRPQFTEDGKPICFRCKGVGYIAKECTQHKPVSQAAATSASVQEN